MGRKKTRLPFSVTLLADLVLFYAVFNLARAGRTLAEFSFLQGILPFSPVYFLVSGLFWGLAGLIIIWWILKRWRAGRWLPIVYLSLYSLFYWLDRILIPGYLHRNMNWLFVAGMNLFVLGWVVWVCTRPKVRLYFEGTDEQRPEESTAI